MELNLNWDIFKPKAPPLFGMDISSSSVKLVELADARMMSDSGSGEQGARFAAKLPQRTRVAAPEEFSFDLAPAQQTVRATIEARFRISQPDLVKLARG